MSILDSYGSDNNVAPLFEITIEDVKNHLRLFDDDNEEYLEQVLEASIMYVVNHTGLSRDNVRCNPDLKQAVLVLCSDFYWNRDYQTSNKYNNRLVDSIIENNRKNFIG